MTTCALTAATLTVLAGCGMSGGGTAAGGGAANGESIVIDEPFAPAANWALETFDAFALTKAGCLETLVKSENGGTLAPMLATSWTRVKPTVWKLELRQGVTFQDGTPLDAKAVTGALQHALKVKTPAAAFSPDVVSGVKAVDSSTVEVTTVKPDVLLPQRLASPNAGILAPKAYSGAAIDPKGTCTGPFEITKEVPQQAIELKRNDSYWGGRPRLASAEVRFIADGGKRATQVRTGEANIARKIPVTSVQELKGDATIRTQSSELPRTTQLILNHKKALFANAKVRQAFQAAIDTKAISDAVYPGASRQAVGPFAPGDPWTPKGAAPVKADPAKAKSLLAEAGVDPSSLKLTLLAYNEGSGFADLASVLQEQLKAIGVKVSIRSGEYASMEPDMLSGDFDMALLSRNYLADLPDPYGFLSQDYSCKGSFNLAHYCDATVDSLIKKAGATAGTEARYALYADIAARLQSQAVRVFLVHETESVALAGVKGYQIHPYYTLTADLSLGSQ
ncbi:ABC transporter substrate-binding protein [Streptomyces sp. ActVer]|uniref:ABC transporter substrate-binding protein n=1 Tax=Streptomyces sp. ActVer TaxID=3014558 RepID=UPI0022B43DB1|nr:ABC transporter substrate-binding protein [Streptomyces sp. ActVer]MCZ4508065.1 ABC transporter substrate-binding protein [Streptomyces sp. ActVer]